MKTGRPAGRPPKPAALKIAEGNLGKRKIPTEPGIDPIDDIPEPPVMTEEKLATWHRVWTQGKEWLTEADYDVVEEFCHITSEKETLRRMIELGEVQRTYRTKGGETRTHPIIQQLAAARTQWNTLVSMLGFSPTDRARLGVMNAAEDAAWAEIMLAQQRRAEQRRKQHQNAANKAGNDD